MSSVALNVSNEFSFLAADTTVSDSSAYTNNWSGFLSSSTGGRVLDNGMRPIFMGANNDFSVAVCLNAAAGLLVAEKSNSFKEGYEKLRKHILAGKVINCISKLAK